MLTSYSTAEHTSAVQRQTHMSNVVWFLALCMAIALTIFMWHQNYERFMDNPTVISIESDYTEWNISLSSVFICPEEKVYEEFLSSVSYKIATESDTDINIVSSFLRVLANLSYYNLDSMKNFTGKINIPPIDYMQLVKAVSFNFSYKHNDPSMEELIPMYTDFGLCYTYNSQIAKMRARNMTEVDGNGVYKIDPPHVASHLKYGTSRVISTIDTTFQVYLTSTWDVPTVTGLHVTMRCPVYCYLTVYLGITPLVATQAVRNVNIDRRKCRFYDESNLKISSLYSMNLCQSQCRVDLAMKKCGCAPFFYEGVLEAGYKICNLEGMLCLADIADTLIFIQGKKAKAIHPCKCYPTCESDSYISADEPHLQNDSKLLGGSRFEWKITEFPKIRSKRSIMFTLSDLLVAFGGSAGFFLGFSVLSIVEIVYYITLRPFFYMRDMKRLQKENEKRRRITLF